MKRNPANGYIAIRDEAAKIGLPKAFTRDLTFHDRQWIERNIAAPFVWIPRDCGTFICRITAEPLNGAHPPKYAWDAPRWNKDEQGARFYMWDGKYLQEYRTALECSEAIRTIAEREGEDHASPN